MSLARLLDQAKPIRPGYEVTPDGRVFSTDSDWRGYGRRELVRHFDQDGYLCVRIRGERLRVHKLVADLFLPEPKPGQQLRHLNGNKLDNRWENLAWGTAKENAADREAHGRTARGERNGFAKLTEDQVRQIRARIAGGESQASIARDLGIAQQTVSAIHRRETWRGTE